VSEIVYGWAYLGAGAILPPILFVRVWQLGILSDPIRSWLVFLIVRVWTVKGALWVCPPYPMGAYKNS
jgi:hypothetical protein